MNLRAWLTHDNALILSLGAALLLMGRHVYHVYHAGAWGLVAAAGLSVATMQFILRGHERRAYVFAMLDMTYNLAFFGLLTPTLRGHLDAGRASEYLLSIAIPVVLAFYAHDYAHTNRTAQAAMGPGQEPAQPAAEIAEDAIPQPQPAAEPAPSAEHDSQPAAEAATCYADGCDNPAEVCPDCGQLRCKTHAGTHKRYHCGAKRRLRVVGGE